MTGALFLALDVDGDGAHPAAWRHAGRPPGSVLGGAALRAVTADAENAGFALVTFADSPVPPSCGPDAAGRIEAGTRAAFASTITDRIGLAPTLHVTTTEPFHLATQLASLDHASHGRAAWVVGAANGAVERQTIGADPLPADVLRREITDVIDVARSLWDSWEDDAVVKDVATGRYLDPAKVHHVDFTGAAFTVKGPLITPRPPQGQVVVIAHDDTGVTDRADVVLVTGTDVASVGTEAARVRRAGADLVVADVDVVLDADIPASTRLADLDAATPWPHTGRIRHVGPPAELVALLRELAGVVDGVRLHPAVLASDLPVLAERVLPELASAGLLLTPRAGDTLRTTLGLPRPANRFATTAARETR
ncbi:LLM class flavin-dependent oxidoreductase [Pseudonocardia endophytica]|uniref:Luciferase-like monooxygenase n=1 Tax=Pseudonocardia endophytica TaxID=401976 RepID=A0A4R1HM13_PSEEN|nr:LLM class flavin-dependent oxidoreductase [Pseudonocardia endophytica]TCK22151.1 luciferase-like monooxygenase [Pseudonocardia endophytica]